MVETHTGQIGGKKRIPVCDIAGRGGGLKNIYTWGWCSKTIHIQVT